MARLDLKDLAMRGAAAKLGELQAEAAALLKAFPALRKGKIDGPFTRRGRIAANTGGGATIPPGRKRRRRKMSAAQKAEVSRRMKAYWASRRRDRR
jgi:hypothetical protein